MDATSLSESYRSYIDCLNRQDWVRLETYLHDDVEHNGRPLKVSGYRDMLIEDFETILDLRFTVQLLVCEPPHVAARLVFRCSPKGDFLGLKVDGRRVSFAENVFYAFESYRIRRVWSVVDKPAIEAQLPGR